MSKLVIFLPLIFGFLSGYLCNTSKSSGETVKFRPPSQAFGVAWSILYLLIGFSWYNAILERPQNAQMYNMFFVLLNAMLCLWVYVYSCQGKKKDAIYVIVLSIVAAMFCYTVVPKNSKLMIVPLLGWLFLATLLNVFEVQYLPSN